MEFKNKKFTIFGSVYKIEYCSRVSDENDDFVYGKYNSSSKTIYISTHNADNKSLPIEEINITLLHELFHTVLTAGQYNNCSDDEPLVEWLARCVNSLQKQKVL